MFCSLGHFQVGSFRYRGTIEGLYTLNSPSVATVNVGLALRGRGMLNPKSDDALTLSLES